MASYRYVTVIFPLALPANYTYSVPEHLLDQVQVGKRVEAPLRNKIYAGMISALHENVEDDVNVRPFYSLLDDKPLLSSIQIDFWTWMARYYCCTLGEVMEAALPAGLKLDSETRVVLENEVQDHLIDQLTNEEYLIAEALSIRGELTIDQVKDILQKKSIMPIIRSLQEKRLLRLVEELTEKFKPRKKRFVALAPSFTTEEGQHEALSKVERSKKQYQALITFFDRDDIGEMELAVLMQRAAVDHSVIGAMVKKGIFILSEKEVARISEGNDDAIQLPALSNDQQQALHLIHQAFDQLRPVLLHGVTGSGKTRIYIELITEALKNDKQVLYLLPEIALTSQIVERLFEVFGNNVLMYHSKMPDMERVEVWKEAAGKAKLIIAARSGIFLPFDRAGLIIVDEEHDASYKQTSPNPHYNARDVALYLAMKYKAHIILGSATPSLESAFNVKAQKFQKVSLTSRFGEVSLPQIEIVDLVYERKTGRYKPVLSVPLQRAMAAVLERGKQVILFQNRRGYVPTIQCKNCGWTAMCTNCDVNLTYHKFANDLSCHYCQQRKKNPSHCPDCGSPDIGELGLGTEKLENVVKQYFPNARVGRLDFDTTRTKAAQDKLILSFARGELDVMVGTQMVTKGFDFDHVALVGVIDADALIRFPDFRAVERAYQLMTQVAGRAGRRQEMGKVMIQTYSAEHPVIKEVVSGNFDGFVARELAERKQFWFPPFCRLIVLDIRHSSLENTQLAAKEWTTALQDRLGERVKGPIVPSISRVRNQYIRNVVIKLEKDDALITRTKQYILQLKDTFSQIKELKMVRVNIDVDPY
ncbi:MAG TPA: primosomal protein N' [Saprospiraceae bacterium]|nr:primosomal protein N' [Saprospiraceae bacterium]